MHCIQGIPAKVRDLKESAASIQKFVITTTMYAKEWLSLDSVNDQETARLERIAQAKECACQSKMRKSPVTCMTNV